MLSTEITETRDNSGKDPKETAKYVPPVYPEVAIPVPDLDWSKLKCKECPWHIRLAVGIISSVVSISETLNTLIRHRRI